MKIKTYSSIVWAFEQEEKDDNLVSAIDGIKDDELSNLENGNGDTEALVAENDEIDHRSAIESNISDINIGDQQDGDETNEDLCENAIDYDCPGR